MIARRRWRLDGNCRAMDRGLEEKRTTDLKHEREPGPGLETDRELDHKSQERSAGRDRAALDSGKKDRESDRGGERSRGSERDSGQEKAAEPKQKSVELDFEM